MIDWPYANKGGAIAFSIRFGEGLLISQIYKELKLGLLVVVLFLLVLVATVLMSVLLR